MLNIKYNTHYNGDPSTLIKKTLPKNSIKLDEPDDDMITRKGYVYLLPVLIFMISVFALKFLDVFEKIEDIGNLLIFFITWLVFLSIAVFIMHEIVHCIFYSYDTEKIICNDKFKYFVYCEECVSKKRFIWICLAPGIILGVLQFVSSWLLEDYISISLRLGMMFSSIIGICICTGDVFSAINVMKNVPNNYFVQNNGKDTYMINPDRI